MTAGMLQRSPCSTMAACARHRPWLRLRYRTARDQGERCGLSGVRERASIIGAMLTMESGPNGTKVTLVSPMNIVEGKEVDA